MASQTTKIGIVNRGLQLLGSPQINSLTENSRGAKAMSRAYDSVKFRELRLRTWNFSIVRAAIPASASPPVFGRKFSYPLPGDFLFLAPQETTGNDPKRRDWQIEGQCILSRDDSPLNVRYVSSAITESMFDVLFAEVLSASLAMNTCEEITNSNSKKADAQAFYKAMILEATRRNAFENPPVRAPTSSWITVRV